MMKRLVVILFLLALLSGAVLFVAPSFVDWDKHREKLAGWFGRVLGVEVVIAGHADLSLLPQPKFVMHDVAFAADRESTEEPFLSVKEVELELPIGPLLNGQIDIRQVHLVSPALDLDRISGLVRRARTDGEKLSIGPITADKISLEWLLAERGTIMRSGKPVGIDEVRILMTAQSLSGPFAAEGEALIDKKMPLTFKLGTAVLEEGKPLAINLKMMPGLELPEFQVSGVVDFADKIELQGEFTAENGSLARYYELISFGLELPALREKLSAKGTVLINKSEIKLDGINIAFPGTNVVGSASLAHGDGKPHLKAKLEADRLAIKPQASGDFWGFTLPESFAGELDLAAGELTLGNKAYTKAGFSGRFDNQELTIKSASFRTKGKAKFDMAGTWKPAAKEILLFMQGDLGDFPAFVKEKSEDAVLQWFSEQAPSLKGEAKMTLTPDSMTLSELSGTYGEAGKFTGDFSDGPAGRKVNLSFSALDASGLLPVPGGQESRFFQLSKQTAVKPGSYNLTVDEIKFPKTSAANVVLKGQVSAEGVVTIEEIKSHLPFGGSLLASGKIGNLEALTGIDLQINLDTQDYGLLTDNFGFVDWPGFGRKAQSLQAKLKLSGTAADLAFVAEADSGPLKIKMNGNRIKAEGKPVVWKSDFRLTDTKGLRHIFSMDGIELPAMIKDQANVDFYAKVEKSGGRVSFHGIEASFGDADFSGTAVWSHPENASTLFEADLSAASLKLNDMFDTEALSFPKDTRFDVKLKAKEIAYEGMAFSGATVDVGYSAAGLDVRQMDAGLWDGKVALSARLRPSGATRDFDLKASLENIEGEALLSKTGLSGMSADGISATLDLAASGLSRAEMLASLKGQADFSADKGIINRFAPAALPGALGKWNRISAELPGLVINALRSGKTHFTNLAGKAAVTKGAAKIDTLSFQFADGRFDATGKAILTERRYDLNGFVSLTVPESFPTFGLVLEGPFDGDAITALSDVQPLEEFVMVKYGQAFKEQVKAVASPPPPAPDEEGKVVVDDILKRLENEDGPDNASEQTP